MSEPSNSRTFTESEHFAVLTAAVQRETAELQTSLTTRTTERDEAVKRADVLEAEKAVLTADRDKAVTEFAAFKTEVETKAEIASRKDERIAAAKTANPALDEKYFTPERAQRWAEMDEATFKATLEDIAPVKPSESQLIKPETAAFTGGDTPTSSDTGESAVRSFFKFRQGATQ